MDQPLPIFSARAELPSGTPPVPLLAPLWHVAEPDDDPACGRYARYANRASGLFTTVERPADAAVIVAPCEWHPENPAQQAAVRHAIETAVRAGKPCVVFYNHDDETPTDLAPATVFRTSLRRSTRRPNEHAMPAWSEDLLERHAGGTLQIRPYANPPTVSFCGLAESSRLRTWFARLRRFGRPNPARGRELRGRILRTLRNTPAVRTNFVIHDRFWGGSIVTGKLALDVARERRKEFVANLLAGDYGLCVRGAGNFSYRLYETMSLGRIPLFVDTDCVLPGEEWIDWRQLCVWVERDHVSRIGEAVVSQHHAFTAAEFAARQRRCRAVWEDSLSPHGFLANFTRYIPSR